MGVCPACAGAILLGSGVVGGYCIYGLASFLYYAIYPPVRPQSAAQAHTVYLDP